MLAVVIAMTAPAAAIGEFDCVINPSARVKLSAPVPGMISEVLVDRGDVVSAGQLVAHIEASVEKANAELARLKAQNEQSIVSTRQRADYLRRKADRLERLRTSQAVSEAQYDEALTESRVADANLRDALSQLEMARVELARSEEIIRLRQIRSPIAGVVVERNLSAGEYRHEQAHVMTIARVDPLHVEVFVPTRFHRDLRHGMTAKVLPEAHEQVELIGVIDVVDRVLDAGSGTLGVRLLLPNPGNVLPAGLRCRVVFDAAASAARSSMPTDRP